MNQPLASAAGNAVEVQNAVDFLTGTHRDPRLEVVTLALAGEMLALTGLSADRQAGIAKARAMLESGKAAELFGRMVAALGGPVDFVETPQTYLARAKLTKPVAAPMSGHINHIATRDIGLAVVELGGGRRKASDIVNPAVGLTGLLSLGDRVEQGDPLCLIHADSEDAAQKATAQVLAAYQIGDAPAQTNPIKTILT